MSFQENSFFLRTCFHRPRGSQKNDLITCTITVTKIFRRLSFVPWGFLYLILRENFLQNLFFVGIEVFFVNHLCFQQPLRCYGTDLITCTMTAIIICGVKQNVACCLPYSVTRKSPKIVFLREESLFLRICFHRPRGSQRSALITCTIFVTKLCRPPYFVRWGFLKSMIREKTGRNLFSLENKHFFFKNLYFRQPLGCYGNDLTTCTMIAIMPCGA